MAAAPDTYKRLKDPRKKPPVRRVSISPEARAAYEETMRQRDAHAKKTESLPDTMKGKR